MSMVRVGILAPFNQPGIGNLSDVAISKQSGPETEGVW